MLGFEESVKVVDRTSVRSSDKSPIRMSSNVTGIAVSMCFVQCWIREGESFGCRCAVAGSNAKSFFCRD